MAAVRRYYEVEDVARELGAVAPMAAVTGGPGTPAFDNFKLFIDQQKQAGRRSVTVNNTFSDWSVRFSADAAEVTYSILQTGHDVDAATGRPVESDQTTPKLRYRASLNLRDGTWLVMDRLRLGTDGQ